MNWNSAGAATIDASGNINFAGDAWVKAAATTTAPGAGGGTVPYGGSSGSSATQAPYNGGATQAPYNGGGGAATSAYGNAVGSVQGDPHVRIQAAGEQPICYDIEGEAMDFISLFDDRGIELEINGFLEHIKGGKNRLGTVSV